MQACPGAHVRVRTSLVAVAGALRLFAEAATGQLLAEAPLIR